MHMTDNTTDDGSDFNLDGAHDIEITSYDIDPADAHIADEITTMDPLSLPSAHEIIGNPRMPTEITLSALPPKLRAAAQAKMGVRVSEAQAVQSVLRDNALDIRSRGGFAASVPPYWHEHGTLTREHNDLLARFDKLSGELAESVRYEKGDDGKPKAVVGMSEARQRAITLQQRELLYRAGLLFDTDGRPGPEGQRRLDKALLDSVAQRKAQAAQIAEHKEADEMARKIARDERIAGRAEGLAKRYRTQRPS